MMRDALVKYHVHYAGLNQKIIYNDQGNILLPPFGV